MYYKLNVLIHVIVEFIILNIELMFEILIWKFIKNNRFYFSFVSFVFLNYYITENFFILFFIFYFILFNEYDLSGYKKEYIFFPSLYLILFLLN